MKKYLLTGLITLLPIAITVIVVVYLFNLFTTPFAGMVEKLLLSYEQNKHASIVYHETLVMAISHIIVLILLFLLILLLGILGRKFFFSSLLRMMNKLFLHIPIIKTIYRLTREITSAVFSGEEKTFKQTVLVPFPTPQTHALGFITGDLPEALREKILSDHLSVFVPTAPHPISGFLLLAPKKALIEVDVTVEDTFKFLISCGVIHPPVQEKKQDEV